MARARLRFATHDAFAKQRIPEVIQRNLGERYGLARALFQESSTLDDPRFFLLFPDHADPAAFFGLDGELEFNAGGIGTSLRDAAWGAFGEYCERYSLCHRSEDSIVATRRELQAKGLRTLGREDAGNFTDEQARRDPFFANANAAFSDDSVLTWSPMRSLITGEEVFVPDQLIYLAPSFAPNEHRIGYAMTTGAATGPTLEAAAISGLNECVERDAFAIWWLNHRAPPRVALDDKVVSAFYAEKLEKPLIKYHVLDLTTDIGYPVMLALSEADTQLPMKATVGAAASLDPARAATKALIEAAQGRTFLKYLGWRIKFDDIVPSQVGDLTSNVRYYAEPRSWPEVSWLLDSPVTRSLASLPSRTQGSPAKDLAFATSLLDAKGLEPLVRDITAKDIRDATGLTVAKVLVPGLAQLYVPRWPILASRRLYEAPMRMGLTDHVLDPAELSTQYLHPFP